jgi:hypothetical protein
VEVSTGQRSVEQNNRGGEGTQGAVASEEGKDSSNIISSYCSAIVFTI